MDFKDKIKKFNQRWNIDGDINSKDGFAKFKTATLNTFENIDDYISSSNSRLFCSIFGLANERRVIFRSLFNENDQINFYKKIEIIFSFDIFDESFYTPRNIKDILYKEIYQAIDFSNINLATTFIDDGEIIFYPKGEEVLDKDLVNNVLSFLDKKSNNHFVEALNFYSDKKWIKSAESLRRSLEEFLRLKLKNNAGLKANILEISKRLKDEKSPVQARNIIVSIFNYIDNYFNEESKHKDGDLKENEAEFLIYQIALLMRYINKQI